MKSARSAQFGQLRARIEATFSTPTLLVVTSAARSDGKTATAFGLAESLAAAQHRVLFVDANAEAPVLARIHHLPAAAHVNVADVSRFSAPVAGKRFEGVSFAESRFETDMSMDSLRAAVLDMRTHFDFIVVDTAPLIRSDLAVLFSTVADGTLLTLRVGRLPHRSDEQTMNTLNRVGASVLGLLTVEPAMIKSFVTERQTVAPTIRVPARHVTSRHTIEPTVPRNVTEPARASVMAETKFVK